jgi:hypothetical protein
VGDAQKGEVIFVEYSNWANFEFVVNYGWVSHLMLNQNLHQLRWLQARRVPSILFIFKQITINFISDKIKEA